MKRVMVLGTGAQGGAIARLLDREAGVSEIICADYDQKAVESLAGTLEKAQAVQVNAKKVDDIIRVGKGADIVVNALPIDFNMTVMEAALKLKANYQDLCMTELPGKTAVESTEYMFTEQNRKFVEAGILAITNTGSAPGLANVVVRETVDKMDGCNSIEMNVYEGVWSKKFIPFWWSPEVAFQDMSEDPIRFENGRHITTEPFANPVMMRFPGIDRDIRMVDHSHEEPVTMGLNAEKCLKGVKNIVFRYGGPHTELSEALYRMGFLSREEQEYKGFKYVPFDLVLHHAPAAPKYTEEIRDIIDGGLITEEGAFQVVVKGIKDGKPITITVYVNAPGLIDAFRKAGISHESYLTGQSAFIFTKMMVKDVVTQTGLISPEVLEADARKFFFDECAKLEITFDEIIEHRIN